VASQSGDGNLSTTTMVAMIVFLTATWWVLHRIAHAIVTEYGLLGGLIACGAIYITGLIIDRRS
jgi:hypothetical protein